MKHYEKARECIKSGMSQIIWKENPQAITSFKIGGYLLNGEREDILISLSPKYVMGHINNICHQNFEIWSRKHISISEYAVSFQMINKKGLAINNIEEFKIEFQKLYDEWLLFEGQEKDRMS